MPVFFNLLCFVVKCCVCHSNLLCFESGVIVLREMLNQVEHDNVIDISKNFYNSKNTKYYCFCEI